MAASTLSILLFSTFIAASLANPAHFPSPKEVPPPKEKEVKELPKEKGVGEVGEVAVVQGMVYCQRCARTGTWSLEGAKPLAEARVGVSCKDHKNRVRFYKAVQADRGGYFYAPIEGSTVKNCYKGGPAHACTVRLLSSPDGDCNLLTNINGGIDGAPLRDGKKSSEGKGYSPVVYSAGPLAFRPAYCPPLTKY